uniref:Uncharacterized protein n=1 Tax=Catagonus wagneri TaxID=51154 RepID=A0A8C3YE60_9CETA
MIVFMYLFVRIVHTISPNVIVCKSALSRFVVLLRVTWVANQAANQNIIFCINVIKLKNDIDAEKHLYIWFLHLPHEMQTVD